MCGIHGEGVATAGTAAVADVVAEVGSAAISIAVGSGGIAVSSNLPVEAPSRHQSFRAADDACQNPCLTGLHRKHYRQRILGGCGRVGNLVQAWVVWRKTSEEAQIWFGTRASGH